MSTEAHREDSRPPQPKLDEGYWESLLTEGEFAKTVDIQPMQQSTSSDEVMTETHHPTSQNNSIHHEQAADWDDAEQIMESDQILKLKVLGYNRGGLLVEWQSLRGFVPASQLMNFPLSHDFQNRRNALVDRVGDMLELRVIEIDPAKNRLILSERAAQVEAGTRDNILHNLSSGDIVEGCITNLCDFGAFVDLGGIEGLIHISELSWGRVGHPSDMLARDQQVQAYVLEVDPNNSRIALSMKRLKPDPWATVEQQYCVGEIVEGRITNVVDFGAFACIEEGLEGLIHFSELAEGHFLHPRNVVQEGDIVHARILSIDGEARRLGLSLRLL